MPEWENIDFSRLIYECQLLVRAPSDIREHMEKNGVTLLPVDQYSPVPLLGDLADTFEGDGEKRLPVYGHIFDRELVREYINGMADFAAEFEPPRAGDIEKCTGFYWDNPLFSFCDAMAYYCLIRMRKPRRIVEIGSGFSTFVASAAIEKNGFGEIVCIEPFPRPFLASIPHVTQLIEKKIQSITPSEFHKFLEPASILFIDSTHTVKIGSDCLYIYLILMPSVTNNLLVHSHDIYLPFGMLTEFSRDYQIHWNEQYLLYAYLVGNNRSRVIYGSYYAYHYLPEELTALMSGKYPIGGASIWYEINRLIEHPL
jgi:hypothetical protein